MRIQPKSVYAIFYRVLLFISILIFPLICTTIGYAIEIVLPLRVGYIPIISQLPLSVSYEMDQLKYLNVDVSLRKYSSFTSLEAAVRVEALDAAYVPLPIALSMLSDGIKIKIVGSLHEGGSMLASLTPGGLASLKGKKIGVPGLDSNENFRLRNRLAKENLRYGLDYRTISVPFNSVVNDITSQRIDALYFPEPYIIRVKNSQHLYSLDDSDDNLSNGQFLVLVIRSRILQKDFREEVKEWLASVLRAARLIDGNPSNGRTDPSLFKDFKKIELDESLAHQNVDVLFTFQSPDRDLINSYLKNSVELQMIEDEFDIDDHLDMFLIEEILQEGDAHVRD